jgi:3-mercaptopyruvate sulfurtransferase SseA
MPNSLNVPYTEVFDQTTQSLKSQDELKKGNISITKLFYNYFLLLLVFTAAGVDLSKPGIYSCVTGTTASTLAFAAHVLGQKSVSVYNVRSVFIFIGE